jgi:hypothetical protein
MYITNQSPNLPIQYHDAYATTGQNRTKLCIRKTSHPDPDLPRYTIAYSKINNPTLLPISRFPRLVMLDGSTIAYFRLLFWGNPDHNNYPERMIHFKTNLIHKAERLYRRPPPEARQPSKFSWILIGTRQSQRHRHSRDILMTGDHGNVLLLKVGKHMHILTHRYHAVLLGMKLGLQLGLKLLKVRDVIVKGRRRERTPLLVLLKSWGAKNPLKRPLPYIHVPSRVHHVTDRCNPWKSR